MRIRLIVSIILSYATFTASAYDDAVNVASCVSLTQPDDTVTVSKDSLQTSSPDTLQRHEKKGNWFVKAYNFLDRVLSPPRDSNYIDVQNYNWCAELQLTSRFEQYELDGDNGFHLKLSPELRTRIGPFFGWRWAFLGYNFDLKSLFINSEDTDLGGTVYSAAFG